MFHGNPLFLGIYLIFKGETDVGRVTVCNRMQPFATIYCPQKCPQNFFGDSTYSANFGLSSCRHLQGRWCESSADCFRMERVPGPSGRVENRLYCPRFCPRFEFGDISVLALSESGRR